MSEPISARSATADSPRRRECMLRALESLEARADELHVGYQLAFWFHGKLTSTFHGSAGDRQVAADSLFLTYCAGKPVLAVAVAMLVAEGELSFDDRLGDVLGDPLHPTLASVTIAALLTQQAGTARLRMSDFATLPLEQRTVLARMAIPDVDLTPCYSEAWGWLLLEQVVSAAAGEPWRTYVNREVIGRYGLSDQIGYVPDDITAFQARHCIHQLVHGPLTNDTAQLSWEVSSSQLNHPSAASGLWATADGLLQFYTSVFNTHSVEPAVGAALQEMVSLRTDRQFDRTLNRDCYFAGGFLAGLIDHQFGRLSSNALGHSGLAGCTFAFADPINRLIVAANFTSIPTPDHNGHSPLQTLRSQFVDTLLDADPSPAC